MWSVDTKCLTNVYNIATQNHSIENYSAIANNWVTEHHVVPVCLAVAFPPPHTWLTAVVNHLMKCVKQLLFVGKRMGNAIIFLQNKLNVVRELQYCFGNFNCHLKIEPELCWRTVSSGFVVLPFSLLLSCSLVCMKRILDILKDLKVGNYFLSNLYQWKLFTTRSVDYPE